MRRFTESHEWISIEGEVGRVGVTDYAQRELGEIVYVELPTPGEPLRAGEEGVVLESTKAAADVYSPVSGQVTRCNDQLKGSPELVNRSAEGEGWLFELRLSDPSELDPLLDEKSYRAMVGG